jgi:hypothetical protein
MLRISEPRLPIKALPIDMPSTRMPIVVATLKNRTVSSVARLFIDCAHEVTKPVARATAPAKRAATAAAAR